MFSRIFKSRFPIWEFLNQPLFDPETALILNPSDFWQHYRVILLERCWSITYHDGNKYPRK